MILLLRKLAQALVTIPILVIGYSIGWLIQLFVSSYNDGKQAVKDWHDYEDDYER